METRQQLEKKLADAEADMRLARGGEFDDCQDYVMELRKQLRDMPVNEEPKTENLSGWTKLYHPRGPQVTLPVPCNDYAAALEAVGLALDAGWLVQAPGLEEGEEKQVGWVLRGGFERDGQITPFVLLYAASEQLTWSFLKVYLNTEADVAAFEYASKVKLKDLPDYVGNDKPQRGASAKSDKYIVPTRHFGVVFKKNPKHDQSEEGKMKPARLFVRWVDQRPAIEAQKPAEADKPAKDDEPPFDEFEGQRQPTRLELEREVESLLVKTGKSLGGLMTWLKKEPGTKLSGLKMEDLLAARSKLQTANVA